MFTVFLIYSGDFMKKFIYNIKNYSKYAIYSARAELKADVAGSYLNWLWWILDPLFFMLIYMFISEIVFGRGEPNFPVFVFCGLTCWNFFNGTVTSSVKIVRAYKSIITKINIPKYILLLQKIYENMFKFFVSCGLILVFMIFYRVPFTVYLFNLIPVLIIFCVLTFGISCVMLHFGIYVADLSNIVPLLLRLIFYMSGIFFSISTRIPAPYNDILRRVNPVALVIDSFRRAILYAESLDWVALGIWFFIGILISVIGISIIQKYEGSYAKVMQ
jgi:ABC-type polysaccharide/polyol phosphate export permease